MAEKDATDIKSKSSKTAVAAIDFGTTYSGFAFSWKCDWSKVQVISNQSADFMSRKVPTSLLLKPESASKFGYHRYYRKKDESHGYFFYFYRIFEEHDVKNDEYKTCRWNIL